MNRFILVFLLLLSTLGVESKDVVKIQVASFRSSYSPEYVKRNSRITEDLERYYRGRYYCYMLKTDFNTESEALLYLQELG